MVQHSGARNFVEYPFGLRQPEDIAVTKLDVVKSEYALFAHSISETATTQIDGGNGSVRLGVSIDKSVSTGTAPSNKDPVLSLG